MAVVLALVLDGNHTKALRVGLAAATYLFILSTTWIAGWLEAARWGEAAPPPSAPLFLIAGGAAGLVNGIARPEVAVPIVAARARLPITRPATSIMMTRTGARSGPLISSREAAGIPLRN